VKKQSGFGVLLIEMLVVAFCILLLFSISVPSVVKLAQTNNQNDAITILRSINKSEGWFFRVYNPDGYQTPQYLANAQAGAIGTVTAQNCQTPGLLGPQDASVIQTGNYSGYRYVFTPGTTATTTGPGCTSPGYISYTLVADPISTASGTTHFFTDQTGVIRFSLSASANAGSPAW